MAKYQMPDEVGRMEADPNDKRMLRATILIDHLGEIAMGDHVEGVKH